jgi:hypothetical protein
LCALVEGSGSCASEKVINFFIPQNPKNFLTTTATISFPSETSIHEVSVREILFKFAISTVIYNNIFECLGGTE